MSEQQSSSAYEKRIDAAPFDNETDVNLHAGSERLSSLKVARALSEAREVFESTQIDEEAVLRERSRRFIAETSVFLAAHRAELTKAKLTEPNGSRSDYDLAA